MPGPLHSVSPYCDVSVRLRLARTDALVDAVVYRLYGLTEEEIFAVLPLTKILLSVIVNITDSNILKVQGYKMLRCRNYWCYSAGTAIAWAVEMLLVRTIRGREGAQLNLLVFYGFCIGWVSTTIARYIYPPPKRWELNRRQE
jgi:hypothetical protein